MSKKLLLLGAGGHCKSIIDKNFEVKYIGANVHNNSISIISTAFEHNYRLDQFVDVSTSWILSGSFKIGNNTHVASNNVINQRLRIKSKMMLRTGDILLQNIPNESTANSNSYPTLMGKQ